MARVLVFRHVPFEHLGLIAPALESRGIEYQYVDLWKDPEQDLPFSVHESAGIISMGGPMSANDDQDFLRQELRYVAQAITRSRPILGVCLGSQLLAKAMGAKVYRNRAKEIGWYPVSFTLRLKATLYSQGSINRKRSSTGTAKPSTFHVMPCTLPQAKPARIRRSASAMPGTVCSFIWK